MIRDKNFVLLGNRNQTKRNNDIDGLGFRTRNRLNMIWLLFKNCCNKNKNKSRKPDETREGTNDLNKIIGELLPKLDVFDDPARGEDEIFVTDTHFACLSIVDPYDDTEEALQEIVEADQNPIEKDTTTWEIDDLDDTVGTTLMINNRCTKVTEKHLKSLQCPFTWDLGPRVWKQNFVHRVVNKYGKHNTTTTSSVKFSFEK